MKSRISFFNGGVCRNLLRRCWPLWAGYFALLMAVLPLPLARAAQYMEPSYGWEAADVLRQMDYDVLSGGRTMVFISLVMGILTAMVMFGYLYNSRSCGMMNALPIRRETMFCTAFLTGLAPMLLADLLAALLTAVLFAGQVSFSALMTWLLAAVCANLCFYGFAVFCAMLTGSLLILPVVYLVLNLTAIVVELCLKAVLNVLVYGMSESGGFVLIWLSPAAMLFNTVYAFWTGANFGGPARLHGLGVLGIYAAVGLALAALALLLYRKRNMETATDTVAIPVLKPIFRYCMAFGTALVTAVFVYSAILGGGYHGTRAALVVTALLLLGAIVGWYVAEMLIRKTVRVFPGSWKGLLAVCAALLLLAGAAELDLFGYERRVPAAEDVASVEISQDRGIILREPESIEKAIAFHRSVVDHKLQHEPEIHEYGRWLNLRYTLKDGSTLERSYFLKAWDVDDPADLLLWQELLNAPEAQDQRNTPSVPVTEETLSSANLYCHWIDEQDRDQDENLNLSPEEALSFYREAVLPDLRAHTLGRIWLLEDETYWNTVSNVSFSMDLIKHDALKGDRYENYTVQICMDSEACLRWLRENTQLRVLPLGEAQGLDRGLG